MRRLSIILLILCAFVGVDMATHFADARDGNNPRIIFFPKGTAKERKKKSIFPLFRLFDGGRSRERSSRQKRIPSNAEPHRQSARAAPEIEPKSEDARVILVIGDTLAAGLAKGLDVAFADNPNVKIVSKANGSSGLVRVDAYDWARASRNLLKSEGRIDGVVVMIGVNDRQKIRDGKARHEVRSAEWEALYKKRVRDLLTIFVAAGKPVVWVGLPPASTTSLSADWAYFNDLYRGEVVAEGGFFVDVWKSFLNDEGRYTRRGPDIEGRVVSLRRSDGIHFTGAGYRKLAFFVEKGLRQMMPLDGGGALSLDVSPDGRLIGPRIGAVLPLTGPIASADDPLAGAVPLTITDDTSALYKLTVKGERPPAVPGRADDFRWPR